MAGEHEGHYPLSPINRPDRNDVQRRRRKRRIVSGGGLALALAATASGIAWVTSDSEPKKADHHTFVLPQGFGDYHLAPAVESVWPDGSGNSDPNKGSARVTYRSANGRIALMTSLYPDPTVSGEDIAGSDEALIQLVGTPVVGSTPQTFDLGRPEGGRVSCIGYKVAKAVVPRCTWASDVATVNMTPVVNSGRGPSPEELATQMKKFAAALQVKPVG